MRRLNPKLVLVAAAVLALSAGAAGVYAMTGGGGRDPATAETRTTPTPGASRSAATDAQPEELSCEEAEACAGGTQPSSASGDASCSPEGVCSSPAEPGFACAQDVPVERCYPDPQPAGPLVCLKSPDGSSVCNPPMICPDITPIAPLPPAPGEVAPAIARVCDPICSECPPPVPCEMPAPAPNPPTGVEPQIGFACPVPCDAPAPAPGAPDGAQTQVVPVCPLPPTCGTLPNEPADATPVAEPTVTPPCPAPPPCIESKPSANSGLNPATCPEPLPPDCAVSSDGSVSCPTPGASGGGTGSAPAATAYAAPGTIVRPQ